MKKTFEGFLDLETKEPYSGTRPFVIKDNGKLVRVSESAASYEIVIFLTYAQYEKLQELNESIVARLDLLERQRKTTIEIMRTATIKVSKDMKYDAIKDFNI